ncbi:MAG: enoyl-CoA hydratase-related protein [Burkholderiaceae bacterium]
MPSELLTARHDSTLVLTMRDPGSFNSLSQQLVAAFSEALDVAESDPEVRCVVVRGDGAQFSSGLDEQAPDAALAAAVSVLAESMRVFPKPVLAAVEGTARGGGFALVLACDLVVAARDAQFALGPSADEAAADSVCAWQLTRWLPTPLLQQAVWLGAPIAAPTLHALGLVGWICDSGQALNQALAVARQLAGQAPETLAAAKERVQETNRRGHAGQAFAERQRLLADLAPDQAS